MLFAWKVCRHVRSNAIVLARDGATVGIGAGQMSRVDAVRIAVEKAQDAQPELLAGSALASDAFFPFADGPELAIEARASRAIIQPGGSVRDEEVVAAVDEAGAAMVATGRAPLPPLTAAGRSPLCNRRRPAPCAVPARARSRGGGG